MKEHPSALLSETSKNDKKTAESQRAGFIEAFKKNESKIKDILENGDEFYISDDHSAVDKNMQSIEKIPEGIKTAMQQEEDLAEHSILLHQKNKSILRQMADLNYDNKVS